MLKDTQVTMRVEAKVMKKADAILSSLGMNRSEAFAIFMRQIVINKGLPFSVQMNPQYNLETIQAMQEARHLAHSDEGQFDTAEDMFKSLGL